MLSENAYENETFPRKKSPPFCIYGCNVVYMNNVVAYSLEVSVLNLNDLVGLLILHWLQTENIFSSKVFEKEFEHELTTFHFCLSEVINQQVS